MMKEIIVNVSDGWNEGRFYTIRGETWGILLGKSPRVQTGRSDVKNEQERVQKSVPADDDGT